MTMSSTINQPEKSTVGRRALMGAASVAALAGFAGAASASDQKPKAGPKSSLAFVLVHGAWHGSWCWQRVAQLLRQSGHRVFTPTLTGLADRSHLFDPTIGLKTHIDDVANLIRWEDLDDVVLCGHSYGGMVISGVTQELESRIKGVVYLDAFVAEPNKSLMDMFAPVVRERIEKLVGSAKQIALTPAKILMVNPKDEAWVDAKCTPQPYKTFTDTLPVTDAVARVKTRHFIRAAKYNSDSFRVQAAKLMQQGGWRFTDMPYGHDLMVDAPEELAQLLVETAKSSQLTSGSTAS